MGCTASSTNVKYDDDFKITVQNSNVITSRDIECMSMLVKNLEWTKKWSKFLEETCFIVATFSEEDMVRIRKNIKMIVRNKHYNRQVVITLMMWISCLCDVKELYINMMDMVRQFAVNNKLEILEEAAVLFDDIVNNKEWLNTN